PFVIGGPDPDGFPSAIRLGVPDVQNLANPPGAALAEERPSKPMQPLLEPLQVVRSRPITGAESKLLSSLVEPEVRQLRFAERGRALENRLEHRLEIRGRPRDHAQDLGRRRLLFQRLRQALLELATPGGVVPGRLAADRAPRLGLTLPGLSPLPHCPHLASHGPYDRAPNRRQATRRCSWGQVDWSKAHTSTHT